jgi:hypothetical protein
MNSQGGLRNRSVAGRNPKQLRRDPAHPCRRGPTVGPIPTQTIRPDPTPADEIVAWCDLDGNMADGGEPAPVPAPIPPPTRACANSGSASGRQTGTTNSAISLTSRTPRRLHLRSRSRPRSCTPASVVARLSRARSLTIARDMRAEGPTFALADVAVYDFESRSSVPISHGTYRYATRPTRSCSPTRRRRGAARSPWAIFPVPCTG